MPLSRKVRASAVQTLYKQLFFVQNNGTANSVIMISNVASLSIHNGRHPIITNSTAISLLTPVLFMYLTNRRINLFTFSLIVITPFKYLFLIKEGAFYAKNKRKEAEASIL